MFRYYVTFTANFQHSVFEHQDIVDCCSYENPDYGYYTTKGEECAMLASSSDNHSPGEANVIGTPVSSLHSSLMTSGDDQATLLGRRSCQGFRSCTYLLRMLVDY